MRVERREVAESIPSKKTHSALGDWESKSFLMLGHVRWRRTVSHSPPASKHKDKKKGADLGCNNQTEEKRGTG